MGKIEIDAADWLSIAGKGTLSLQEKGMLLDLAAMCRMEGGSIGLDALPRKLKLSQAAFDKALASLKFAGVFVQEGRLSVGFVLEQIKKDKAFGLLQAQRVRSRWSQPRMPKNTNGIPNNTSGMPLECQGNAKGIPEAAAGIPDNTGAIPTPLDVPPAPPSYIPPDSEPEGSSSFCPEPEQAPAPGQQQAGQGGGKFSGQQGKAGKPKSKRKPAQKVGFDFESGEFSAIPEALRKRWEEGCPAVNIDQELSLAAGWLIANPKNAKKNYPRFLTNWLSKAQDKAARVNVYDVAKGRFVKIPVPAPGVQTQHGMAGVL